MADQTGMKALHMFTTGDPARNAPFVLFADPNYFLTDFPRRAPARPASTRCSPGTTATSSRRSRRPGSGFVGPGVRNLGETSLWTDHADVRPTMLSLLGLTDDYSHDGVVVPTYLADSALPHVAARRIG